MNYYEDDENIDHYIEMSQDVNGAALIQILRQYVPHRGSVLELGMGPGKDLLLLDQYFRVTGSDLSLNFLQRFKSRHPDFDVIQLDARDFEIKPLFDGIYSNKVLQHLTRDELSQSFRVQLNSLARRGILMHSFWYGEGEDQTDGLLSTYYTEQSLTERISKAFKVLEMTRYSELEADDSLYVVLSRHDRPD